MVHTLVAVFVACGAVSAAPISVESGGAKWQSNYTAALAETRKNDRPLLVVLDKPGQAKEAVQEEQLEVKGEQGELLESYELCHVDASTKHGKKVADAFHATEFPFTAIIDKKGEYVLTKKIGQLTRTLRKNTLAKCQNGRQAPKTYSSMFRGGVDTGISTGNTGCKACQLRAMQQN